MTRLVFQLGNCLVQGLSGQALESLEVLGTCLGPVKNLALDFRPIKKYQLAWGFRDHAGVFGILEQQIL